MRILMINGKVQGMMEVWMYLDVSSVLDELRPSQNKDKKTNSPETCIYRYARITLEQIQKFVQTLSASPNNAGAQQTYSYSLWKSYW